MDTNIQAWRDGESIIALFLSCDDHQCIVISSNSYHGVGVVLSHRMVWILILKLGGMVDLS